MNAFALLRLAQIFILFTICLQNPSDGKSENSSDNACAMPIKERLGHGNRFCNQLINTINRTRHHQEVTNNFLLLVPMSTFQAVRNLSKLEVATMHFNTSFSDLIFLHGQALISYRNHLRHQLMPKLLPSYRPEVPYFRYLFTMTDRYVVLVERLICLFPETAPETFRDSLPFDRLQNLSLQLSLTTRLSASLDETYSSPSDSRATLARYVFLHHFYFTFARLSSFYQDLLLIHDEN